MGVFGSAEAVEVIPNNEHTNHDHIEARRMGRDVGTPPGQPQTFSPPPSLAVSKGQTYTHDMKRHAALASLSRDHHHALVMSQALRKGAPSRLRDAFPRDPIALIAAVRQRFATELEPHFRAEETVVVPVAPDAHSSRILGDHQRLRSLLDDLEAGDQLDEQLDAWCLLMEQHVRFEEPVWFPSIEAALSTEDLATLAGQLD